MTSTPPPAPLPQGEEREKRKVKVVIAGFAPYSLYSMAAGQQMHACDDKIFVDLQRFKSIHDIDKVKEYIDKIFGSFEN